MNVTLGQLFRGTLREVPVAPDGRAGSPAADDVDLAAMGRLALNYLRGNPDPARHHECRFALGPLGIPCHVPISPPNEDAFDVVSLGDTDSRMDTQYAHMRAMAGEADPDPVELGVRRRTLGYLGRDGLSWVNPGAAIGETTSGTWAMSWTTSKLLFALAEEYARTGDPKLRRLCRRMFLGLKKMAIWDRGRAYTWGIAPFRDGQWLLRNWCEQHGRNYPCVVEPLLRYYECCADDEALALARAFADGMLERVQPEMGTQRLDPATGAFSGHIHLHTHAIWGVAHLGAVLGEPRYLDWARLAHDFVVSQGTDYGWYPEFAPQGEYRTEICVVGDMISLGAWLARGGRPEYWDTVERTVRNELRRSQFRLTPAFLALFDEVHRGEPRKALRAAQADLRRLEGGFVAQATFDDWVSFPGDPKLGAAGLYANGIQMMGCCSPEGMRGLWEAWNGVVERRPEGVFVNLPFTRDHECATVTAYRPAAGRLDVQAKVAGDYHLRPPAWSSRSAWTLTRDGRPQPALWGGPAQAYVVCRGVRPGESLSVAWPVPRFTQAFEAVSVPGRRQAVSVRWVGSEVVAVEPRGRYLPMFGGED